MLLTFREWWRSLWEWMWDLAEAKAAHDEQIEAIQLGPLRRTRATMGRCVCPRCQRQIAYSSTTQLTALHLCQGERRQGPIGPSSEPVDDRPGDEV